jgi:multiple sugar transport system ATP-binding protein
MGRDKTIVSSHMDSTKPSVRAIVDADLAIPTDATELKFNLKPNKFFLFDGDTEERLR